MKKKIAFAIQKNKIILMIISILIIIGISFFLVLSNGDSNKKNSCIVSFETNGGSEISLVELECGKKLNQPEKPTKEGFDFALGLDSDGDRLGMLDELGNYVDSNEILASIYYYLVKYRGMKGDSVKNCATSNLLDALSNKLGFKCHEVDVGFKNISSKIKEVDALIGGESSGGLTVRNYIYGKDSTFAAMLFIEMTAIMDKSVSQIIKEVRDFACFHHCIVEDTLSYNENLNIKEYLYNNTPKFPTAPKEIRKFGKNVKYIFENNEWAILRLSGTEPVLRVFVEMETKEKTEQYLKIMNDFILAIEKEKISI